MRSTLQSQARLAAVRRDVAQTIQQVMGSEQRRELLSSILSDEQADVIVARRSPRWLRPLPIVALPTATAFILALVFLVLPTASGSGDAYALTRATAVLAQTENAVLYTTESNAGLSILGWYDLAGSKEWRVIARNANGQVVSQFGVAQEGGALRSVDVQYGNQPIVMVGPVSAQELALHAVSTPVALRRSIQTAVAQGKMVSAGRQVIDGFRTLHFVEGNPQKGQRRLDLWIDATTYRLVREQVVTVNGLRIVTDFYWMPRNASTLANLTFTIPSGAITIPTPPLPPNPSKR